MLIKSHAKINLCLKIGKKLKNNYHKIQSVMQLVQLHDTVSFESLTEDRIVVESNNKDLENMNNLAYKAALLLKNKFNIKKGIKIVIACAGLSAALPGVVSSYINIPVIGVPLYSKAFKGIDSLLSILQMPKGIAVGTVSVGSSGMINAVILAARVLALNDKKLKNKLIKYKSKIKKLSVK